MFDLPLGCMGHKVGRMIGPTMGTMEEIDTNTRRVGLGEFL